jgi:hypothetical protein
MVRTLRRTLSLIATAGLGAAPLAAQAPAAPAAPQISVGALTYMQYVYQDAPIHANTFDVKRAYVNVIGRFSGGVYARITADIFTNADSSRAYRIKYAYAQYTPAGSSLTFKLGEIHTPWLDWEEALWDYRVQGQMALERGGYVTSSDFGAGVDFKQGPDRINGQLTFVNGEGYSKGTGDTRKDLMVRASVRVMDTDDSSRVGGLRVTGYGQIGKPTTGGTRNRFLGMVSYRSQAITLAGEFATVEDSVSAAADVKGRVISGFGVYHLPNSKVAIIARVDLTDPNTNVASNQQTRIIGGVSYQLSPNLRLLADLDRVSFESGITARHQGLFQAQFNF